MAWTYKKSDDTPVLVSPEPIDTDNGVEVVVDETIGYDNCGEDRIHPETGEPLLRITVEEHNQLLDIQMPTSLLVGNGWTGKDITMENRQKKALAKNPMHTTMKDYKMSNPDSVVSKARKKNRKRMRKRNVEVKQHETKYS